MKTQTRTPFTTSCLLLTILFGVANIGYGVTLTGTVKDVIDGDSFHLEHDGKIDTIRVRCVDCPDATQPYGPEAQKFTANLITSKTVTIITEPGEKNTLLGKVTLSDGTDLGTHILDAGLGWYRDADGSDVVLRKSAAQAIKAKKGLWKDNAPLAPWDFRGEKLKPKEEPTVTPSDTVDTSEKDEIVWITKDGHEFHKADCAKLDKTQKPIPRKEAEKLKYTPCPTCIRAEPKKDVPVVSLKGTEEVPRVFFPKYKDNPIYQQLQPDWYKDAKGNIAGITAKNLGANPIAATLGFQDGDIIQSINGQSINSEESILTLIDQLKGQKSLHITILRNGAPQAIDVNLPEMPF